MMNCAPARDVNSSAFRLCRGRGSARLRWLLDLFDPAPLVGIEREGEGSTHVELAGGELVITTFRRAASLVEVVTAAAAAHVPERDRVSRPTRRAAAGTAAQKAGDRYEPAHHRSAFAGHRVPRGFRSSLRSSFPSSRSTSAARSSPL